MANSLPMSSMLDALVPISRFNKGEANKIFDEVGESGFKIVVKNNAPACVLLSPEEYKMLIESAEDQYLFAIVAERLKRNGGKTHTMEQVMSELGITDAALHGIEVELD